MGNVTKLLTAVVIILAMASLECVGHSNRDVQRLETSGIQLTYELVYKFQ